MSTNQDNLKRAAAEHAITYVTGGMAVGLGSGSTSEMAVRGLGRRVAEGLKITGVPTSVKVASLARDLGIPLVTLEEQPELDLTIDGADEVDLVTLHAIKGLGGALLREKIVALSSKLEIIIVDEGKIVERLGERTPVPVEVVTFGWTRTREALAALGCEPRLRSGPGGEPYVTDHGNYLLDCRFPGIDDPPGIAAAIKSITGVVEHGLFIDIVGRVIIARPGGVQVVHNERKANMRPTI
jgi:ribose 5-phosphate isomerase A